nr:putative TGB2 protein [Red clover carlavirus 1]
MPLTPPPDHSHSFLAISIGAGLALLVFTLTRNTLPAVGDNIHNLPHGGYYQDGTKRIFYGSPGGSKSYRNSLGSGPAPALLVVLLVAIIFFLSRNSNKRRCCSHVG